MMPLVLPLISQKFAEKIAVPVLKEIILPEAFKNIVALVKYANSEPISKAANFVKNILESKPMLEVIPNIFARLTNIVLMLVQNTENPDKVSIVVSDALISMDIIEVSSLLLAEEGVPGLDTVATILILEELIRSGVKVVNQVDTELHLTLAEYLENLLDVLIDSKLNSDTDNDLKVQEAYKAWLSFVNSSLLNNFDAVVLPIPNVLITETGSLARLVSIGPVPPLGYKTFKCKKDEKTTSTLVPNQAKASVVIREWGKVTTKEEKINIPILHPPYSQPSSHNVTKPNSSRIFWDLLDPEKVIIEGPNNPNVNMVSSETEALFIPRVKLLAILSSAQLKI